MRRLFMFIAVVVFGMLTLAVAFLVGMRAKAPLVQNAVRRFARDVGNPNQMKTAGRPGAYAAVIRHRGRRSGSSYETPVGAVAAGDGFVIALPYGPGTDWCRNVLAAGSSTLVHEGHTYEVDQPEIVSMDAVGSYFSAADQRMHRWFRVDECLWLHRVSEVAAPVTA